MAPRRPIAWIPLVGAMVAGAALAAAIGWRLSLRAMDDRIKDKRSTLKKLVLSGRIPPNEEVMAYLTARQGAIEQRYGHWLERIASPPLTTGASADPQLYFQEQFHEVQRTLERLAAARSVAVPELLGFPKELPPSDTVPRLLVQLSLIQATASLIFEQEVFGVTSFKIEDPEAGVTETGGEGFLTRLPVRVRLNASLPQLTKVLGAIARVTPLVDVDALRIVSVPPPAGGASPGPAEAALPPGGGTPGSLDVEMRLSRYLVAAFQEPPPEAPVTGRQVRATKGGAVSESAPAKSVTRPDGISGTHGAGQGQGAASFPHRGGAVGATRKEGGGHPSDAELE